MMPIQEFKIHYDEGAIEQLKQRIGETRPPLLSTGSDWSLGTDSVYLNALLHYWRDSYDWRRKEQELNQYPQFTCELDGMTIHFFHIRSANSGAKPLLLTHG